ncbi:MAG: amidohydrolase [Candidatus Latescibacterota bacterium]|nr:amidohydrolase [Candidatus Latescibacterota bacterium]
MTTATQTAKLKRAVCEAIDARRDDIVGLGEAIMDTPELGFKEVRTADRVREVFCDLGLSTEDGLALTGVRAELRGASPGPTVALMGELDALIVPDHPRCDPVTGAAHACGHNAQIAGLVGAAFGLAASELASQLAGCVVFLAVPAEEYVEIDYRLSMVREGKTTFLSGKPELLQLGVFDDIDMAVMIHSGSADSLEGSMGVSSSSNGFLAKTVRFRGKAAHAGVAPEQGVNALNAANLALSAINAQRETFRDQDCVRVHPILTKGGDIVNIVPAETLLETYVRALSAEAVQDAAAKVDRAVRGAAVACGCAVEIETVPGYLPLVNDRNLALLFKCNAVEIFGENAHREYPHSGGSTDAGDLSQIMPVLHPVMTGAAGTVHGKDWHIADLDAGYLAPAKTMAMMAVDLLANGAKEAQKVLAESRPALTCEEYLRQQKEVFRTEVFDGTDVG